MTKLACVLLLFVLGCDLSQKVSPDAAPPVASVAPVDPARVAYIAKAAKACRIKPADYIPATKREAAKMCVVFVDGELKVPGSGTYPEIPEENEQGLQTVDGCSFFFDSYVDAKNAFGVTTRTRYRCTYDPKVGLASYKVLQ